MYFAVKKLAYKVGNAATGFKLRYRISHTTLEDGATYHVCSAIPN